MNRTAKAMNRTAKARQSAAEAVACVFREAHLSLLSCLSEAVRSRGEGRFPPPVKSSFLAFGWGYPCFRLSEAALVAVRAWHVAHRESKRGRPVVVSPVA